MRILVLTNFYPPHHYGGMEVSCREMVEGLKARGHSVQVLTSSHGEGAPERESGVARLLALEMPFAPLSNAWRFFLYRRGDQASNLDALKEEVRSFGAEVVFVWGMWNLHRSLAAAAERLTWGRVLYRFADYWPTLPSQYVQYWRQPGRRGATRLLRRILAPIALRQLEREAQAELSYPFAYCVSRAVQAKLLAAGLPVGEAEVIYTGLDLQPFVHGSDPPGRAGASRRKLLYAGRLAPEKGLHVLVEALGRLTGGEDGDAWELTIAGQGEAGYVAGLEEAIRARGLGRRVVFTGALPGEAIPALMHDHGTVVVPSLWEEPLPRTAIEAMAAGCVVVASDVGGLAEIVADGRTGLLAPPDDPAALSRALARLAQAPDLALRMAQAARAAALERFQFERMVDRVESLLARASAGPEGRSRL